MDNDRELLGQLIEEARATAPPGLSDAQTFDLFVAEQTLKDYDLSSDELLAGITEGGLDGGVDAFYVFADDNLLDEDFDTTQLRRGYSLDVYILQNKETNSFAETTFDKWQISLPVLLNVNADLDPAVYSPLLINRTEIFRKLFKQTGRKFPNVRVHLVYGAKAPTLRIDPNVLKRAEGLEDIVKTTVGTGSEAEVTFLGSRELIDTARREPTQTFELVFDTYTEKRGQSAYVALVPIQEYYEFISDSGRLKKYIFEANVRDFEGNVEVNNAIRESLSSRDPDFWWLNNGITILSTQVRLQSGKFIIQDPRIVNGLQTSYSINEHFKTVPPGAADDRLLLVKIIESADEDIRNAIIVATNSQTKLLPSAIRAADEMQKDIEQYFLSRGVYYDRRKNQYKNQGKPANQIYAVPYVAQAVLAIGFGEPDQARGRPSTLIKDNAQYQRIFSRNTPLQGYVWMAMLQREVDKYLKSTELPQEFKINMRFHLSMLAARRLKGEIIHNPGQLVEQFDNPVDPAVILPPVIEELQALVADFLTANPDTSMDKAAKSRDFLIHLNDHSAGLTQQQQMSIE